MSEQNLSGANGNSANFVNTCPNCGYCPCCGRPKGWYPQQQPQWPYPYYPTVTWTFGSSEGTSGGNVL